MESQQNIVSHMLLLLTERHVDYHDSVAEVKSKIRHLNRSQDDHLYWRTDAKNTKLVEGNEYCTILLRNFH